MKTRRRKKSLPVMKKVFTALLVPLEDFETVCRVCEAEFLDEADLKLHIAQVHLNDSNGKTICKICCTVLPSGEDFASHFIFNHLENCSFCFYCYRAFSDPSLLDHHEVKHCAVDEDSAVTCSQCHIILINRQELQKHEYQEHGNSDDGYMLNSYFSLLSSALNMKVNTFLDSICKKETMTCCICKYYSVNLTDYIEHLKLSKCQSFACDECCNVYKNKHSIFKHIMDKPQHHAFVKRKDAQKQCLRCGKHFTWKDLGIHRKLCKIIKCLTCEQRFNSLYELTEHREQEHNIRISLESCTLCKKQFVGTTSLEKHMARSHKNLSLYKYHCVHCDSKFIHPSKLFGHFFSQHKDIEPYTCKICDKSFRLRKRFTIHIKLVHSSVGFVEFDENWQVIFTEKKSENAVAPEENVNMVIATDTSYSVSNDATPAKKPRTESAEQAEHEENVSTVPQEDSNTTKSNVTADENTNSNTKTININNEVKLSTVHIEIERLESVETEEERKSVTKSKKNEKQISLKVEDSEDEPLSNVRQSLVNQKRQRANCKRKLKRMAIRDKKGKLTCKICNKYCYTVQNYHHHMTLHEKTKLKRCIKCNEYFKSKNELEQHTESAHSSSKLVETLKIVMKKRKTIQPNKPCETFKSLLERRKKMKLIMAQNTTAKKFRRTIRKVNVIDDCKATITPMTDHGLSVKKFIENFKPEGEGLNISHSVTLKTVTTPVNKEPLIKMHSFNPDPPPDTCNKLRFPVKFKEPPVSYMETKVKVALVQQLVTKPSALNMCYNERIPLMQKRESDGYCNTYADATDYTQYKSESIPEVAQEVMLEDLEDIPKTKRLAQEILIPKISEEHGGVRIGHLLPEAPFFKIVKVKQLLNAGEEETDPIPSKEVQLPDGTRLISVKNPYSHLIPNDHLKEILKANRNNYYTPKTKNIEKAIAKALNEVKPPCKRGRRKKTLIES